MGRVKKYLTSEEKQKSLNEASHRYYWKNKEKCDAKQRERDRKNKNISNN